MDIFSAVIGCPADTTGPSCPFTKLREIPTRKALDVIASLSDEGIEEVRRHHLACLEQGGTLEYAEGHLPAKKMKPKGSEKIKWQGTVLSVQCRAWVWRYKMDNRTHHHLGFNLWVQGEADAKEGIFIVAVSDSQHQKMQFRIGDEFKGTAWPCIKAKHDIADYYRAGGLKRLKAAEEKPLAEKPPFTNLLPPLEVFAERGARMLDSKLWSKKCFTCMWANKSAVEIEYDFGKVKRYRKETFCYGPKSCPLHHMGKPRPVQYVNTIPSLDTGWMDDFVSVR